MPGVGLSAVLRTATVASCATPNAAFGIRAWFFLRAREKSAIRDLSYLRSRLRHRYPPGHSLDSDDPAVQVVRLYPAKVRLQVNRLDFENPGLLPLGIWNFHKIGGLKGLPHLRSDVVG